MGLRGRWLVGGAPGIKGCRGSGVGGAAVRRRSSIIAMF